MLHVYIYHIGITYYMKSEKCNVNFNEIIGDTDIFSNEDARDC